MSRKTTVVKNAIIRKAPIVEEPNVDTDSDEDGDEYDIHGKVEFNPEISNMVKRMIDNDKQSKQSKRVSFNSRSVQGSDALNAVLGEDLFYRE